MLVEIWSDVVCPWCAVGKVRFERALSQFEHADEVELRWRSFELDTKRVTVPDEDYVTLLATKYRTSRDQAQTMIDTMTESGAAEGLEFRFDIAKPGNTFDAHRVLHLAAARGLQHEVQDRFLAGYHSQGAAIADHATLIRLAVEAGMIEDEVCATLGTDAYADAVRADEDQAHAYGISGVPFFVIDRKVGVSGAQPAQHLLDALRQVHAQGGALAAVPATDAHAHDAACADGACTI
jgi:predicted DsbA family dithiol-disulfide isomerase